LKVRRIYAAAPDLIAFGKRKDRKFLTYDQWVQELIEVANFVRTLVVDKPLFLMGNSLGAVLALAAAEAVNPDGLVLFSPGLDGYPGTFTFSYRLQAVLKALFKPDALVPLPYNDNLISRDEGVKQWIGNDPDRRSEMPARMAIELIRLTWNVSRNVNALNCPVMMMTAGIDQIVNNQTSKRFFKKLQCPRKTHRHFAESWHDLMFDPIIDQLADELIEWMSECAPEKAPAG
jgi:alpha-beta hydrolase superfamily lysophospholipase